MTTTDATDMQVMFLEDGGQRPEQVLERLQAFLSGASQSIAIAIYDCGLEGALAESLADSLRLCISRGVQVRLAYYSGSHRIPGIPAVHGSSQDFVESLRVPTRPVIGFRSLMHQKYVVRDPGMPGAAVWTGSTNWTSDAWSREENMVLEITSRDLAELYASDFEDLWTSGRVEDSGLRSGGNATVYLGATPAPVSVWFSPGQGEAMAHAVAETIASVNTRLCIASPVLTQGSIVGAARDVVQAGTARVSGVYDWTQMQEVLQQWGDDAQAGWKIDAFNTIVSVAHLAGKHSTPYAPGSVHDYMHMKAIVVDDTVFTGSFNFSHSGEENAENLLRIDSAPFADQVAGFIDRVRARYASSAG